MFRVRRGAGPGWCSRYQRVKRPPPTMSAPCRAPVPSHLSALHNSASLHRTSTCYSRAQQALVYCSTQSGLSVLQMRRRLPVRLRFEKLEAKLFLLTRKVHTRQASADDHSIPREVRYMYVYAQSLVEQRYLLVHIGMNIREFTKRLWVPSSAAMKQRRR